VSEADAYPEYQDDLASILKTAGVPAQERPAPDYELEVDENKEATTGQIIKKLLDPVAQGLAGGGSKSSSIPLVGEEETDESFAGGAGGAGLGAIAGGALGATLGGSDASVLAGGVAGGLLGGALGDKATDESEEKDELDTIRKHAGLGKKDMEEGELETAIGAGLGGAVGGIGGAALGGVAGHYLGKKETDEGTDALKNIDWKEVGGSTAGGVGGYMAGNAVGGPLAGLAGATVGSTIGGALAKEGKLGAIAGGIAGGALTKSIKGVAVGAKAGSALQNRFSKEKEMDETANPGVTPADIDGVPAEELDEASRCNMTEAGEMCPQHGLRECGMYEATALQGQYGHSGRMKPVDKDSTFLDRLRELSGMMRK
jgi:hypothetical protein